MNLRATMGRIPVNEVTLDTRSLAPGVYMAHLTAGGASEAARVACIH